METTLSALGLVLDVLDLLRNREARRFLAGVLAVVLVLGTILVAMAWWPSLSTPADGGTVGVGQGSGPSLNGWAT